MLANNIRMSSYKAKTLIDRTTPTTVVNQAYTTKGNGGRKSVRLSDGTLIASARNASTTLYIYRSLDKGETFTSPTNINTSGIPNDWAIVNNKDYIFIILGVGNSTIQVVTHRSRDFAFIRRDNISVTSTSLGNISATINKEGTEIHVCWSDKNSLYPNTFNIRYCKGIIGSDGKGIWDTATQVTIATNNGYSFESPSIVLDSNDYPLIIVSYKQSTYYQIRAIGKNPNLPSTHAGVINISWKLSIIYPTSFTDQYPQTEPSVCKDNDGIIHVSWHGTDNVDTVALNTRYIYSIDDGVTWINSVKITSGNSWNRGYPSITVDKNNRVFIAIDYKGGQGSFSQISLWDVSEKKFIAVTNYNSGMPSTLIDNTLEFERPLMIFTDNLSGSIKFYGKWYE